MVKWLPISGIQSVLYGVLMALGMYCLFEFLTVCSLTSWLSQGSEVCTLKFRTVSTVFSAHLRISGSVQLTSCLSQGSRHRAPTLLIARTPPACTPQCHRHHHRPPLARVWKVEDGVRGEGKGGQALRLSLARSGADGLLQLLLLYFHLSSPHTLHFLKPSRSSPRRGVYS